MKNIAHLSIERPLYPWMLALACFIGGIYGIENVGRLEDPAFPIKQAYVITSYPGASAEEVELEVTDRIEDALQELPYIDTIISRSVSGRSEVQIELQEQIGDDQVQQVYDELRRRVSEADMRLPPGAATPLVEDDFNDVYGILYAVTMENYSEAEIHDVARHLSTQLKRVPEVAKVETRGEPMESINLEIDHSRLTRLGIAIEDLGRFIRAENQVIPAGSVLFDGRRLRIAQSGALESVAALEDLKIGRPGSTEMVRLGDIATIRRGAIEVPLEIIRHDGVPVFTVAVSVTPGANVVSVGRAVDQKMAALAARLPLGMAIQTVHSQHAVVDLAITSFLRNLVISVATVVLALCLFMGWRAGLVVGAVLFLTVMGTIGIMQMMAIELQRISLGALMIAMGMLVDNGIVVAEGMVVGVRKGMKQVDAAAHATSRTQYALLGATIIGITAFAPISLSDDQSGHFLISLFQVVAISLLLSWLLAITIVPLLGSYLLKPTDAVSEEVVYGGWMFRPYRALLGFGLHRAWFTAVIIIAITASGIWALQFVKTGFFPTTNSPLFYVDYRLQEGTDIHYTASDLVPLERAVADIPGVASVTSFVGRGPSRFTSVMRPEQPNSAYARLVVRVEDVTEMNGLMRQAAVYLRQQRPDAEVQVTRAEFSPSGGTKIEVRYSGPDAGVLRELSEKTLDIYVRRNLIDRKTDWRPQSLQLVPRFNEANARLAGVSRNDLARALAYNTLGIDIGLMRDGDKLIPIVARAPHTERRDIEGLKNRQVWSPGQRKYVPMSQIVSEFELVAENTTIYRRDRMRTITVQANQPVGFNATQVFNEIKPMVEQIPLPPGYEREWGGEWEANIQANESLVRRLPIAFVFMFIITILMFGALRQAIVIWLTVPMIVCGVAFGLLVTDLALTFPSFLGVLSLSGMLIKNCIVLVDEIDKRFLEQEMSVETMMLASLSRLRPVLLAAITTILGMSPLLTDAFFREMAVCIMSGLAFATLLTLLAVPVFYRIALSRRFHTSS
jgi:multidrug efflux pump subunit AcrB